MGTWDEMIFIVCMCTPFCMKSSAAFVFVYSRACWRLDGLSAKARSTLEQAHRRCLHFIPLLFPYLFARGFIYPHHFWIFPDVQLFPNTEHERTFRSSRTGLCTALAILGSCSSAAGALPADHARRRGWRGSAWRQDASCWLGAQGTKAAAGFIGRSLDWPQIVQHAIYAQVTGLLDYMEESPRYWLKISIIVHLDPLKDVFCLLIELNFYV